MMSGLATLICFSMFSKAMESNTKTRSVVYRDSSLARFIRAGFVEMIPSALVLFLMKSTATSLLLSPVIRSICTMATLSDALICSTMVLILQISPKRMNTTLISSLWQQASRPSMSFTAAMTGLASIRSYNFWFIGIPPHIISPLKRA